MNNSSEQLKLIQRRKSIRLINYDYSQNGYYFVTICTKGCINYFGSVDEGRVVLSDIGKIAEKLWQEIPQHFPFVKLDEFIFMPSHIHGIIVIVKVDNEHDRDGRDEAVPRPYIYKGNHPEMSRISPKPCSLSLIIGSYKSICSRTINKIQSESSFKWQPRFFEHIIRNEPSLNKIRKYIRNNPQMWEGDEAVIESIDFSQIYNLKGNI